MSVNTFFHLLIWAAVLCAAPLQAQPVAPVDLAALLSEMPAPPAGISEAYDRVYPNGATAKGTEAFYKNWLSALESATTQNGTLMRNFYSQYPTGVRPTPSSGPSRVSAAQQASMNAATSELAQKMMNDPAFAQQFARMSEADQQAYIAKLLAEKGLQPATGQPNMPSNMPAGLDHDWAGICSTLMQSATDQSRWDAQTALLQRYAKRHDDVSAWAAAEINKLPMIEFGEYGHDHDPEKVKAIQQEAARRHSDIADQMLKEALPLLARYRTDCLARLSPLNTELKAVGYGQAYDFGIQYSLVLQSQNFIMQDLQAVLDNEINLIEECAGWEQQRRMISL